MLLHQLDNYLRSPRRSKLARKLYLLLLRILSWSYYLLYLLRKGVYRVGLLKAVKVSPPVISLGNLTWGGTGKTPLVIYLASKLEAQGKKVVVLTRGYQRKSKSQVVLTGMNLDRIPWQEVGDEPYLICKSLNNTAVVINPKRARAAIWAVENLKPDVILLDDGFQHWRLSRDLDVVLIDSQNPFGNGKLLPYGMLREPTRALSRAGLVVLSKVRAQDNPAALEKTISNFYRNEIIRTKYRLVSIWDPVERKAVPRQSLEGKKLLAFCGIGNPESFYSLLEDNGLKPQKRLSLPDHFSYSNLDLMTLEREGLKVEADFLATTAKDGLKIPLNLQLKLPVLIFKIEVEIISGEEILWRRLNQILQK